MDLGPVEGAATGVLVASLLCSTSAAIADAKIASGKPCRPDNLVSRVGWQRQRKQPWPTDTHGQGSNPLGHLGSLGPSPSQHLEPCQSPNDSSHRLLLAPRSSNVDTIVHSYLHSKPPSSAPSTAHCPPSRFPSHSAASVCLSTSDNCTSLAAPQSLLDSSPCQQGCPCHFPPKLADVEPVSASTQPSHAFASFAPAPVSWCAPSDAQPDDTDSAHSSSMVAPPVHPQLDPPPQASGQMAAIFNPMEPQAIAFAMDSFPPEPDFTMFNSQHYGLVNAPLLDQGLSHAHHDAALTNTNPSPKTKRPSSPQPVHDLGQEGDGNVEHDGGQEGPRKRARGRPRLDTKDETAADRRRTQIRLAQRAYRHRKDTAITTLEQKVKDLENANSSLRKGFGQLVNSCMADGALNAAPRVAEQLNLFADRLKKPSCMLRESSSGSAPSDIDESHMKRSSAHVSVVAPAMTHAQPQRPTGNNVNGSPPSIHMPASLSYEVVTQPTRDNASFPFYSSMEASSADAMAPRVYSRLPPPSSYAAHEVTFGRRLHRANCEAGFRLISMKNPPAHRYAAVFGFCLFFESREAVIERLRLTLSRSQLESLSYWRAPFTSLGGAGTFFTSEKTELASQADGMNLPVGNIGTREFDKQPDSTGFSMGPFGPQVEETRKDRLDPRLRMLLPGFEGDFFDADEVEVYLRKLGITIPRSADYVEVDINLGDLEEDSGMAPSGGLATFQGDQAVLGNAGLAPSDSGYGSISGPACRGWSGNSPETEYRMMPSTPQTIATQAMMAPPPVVAPPFANGMARGGHDLNNGFSAFMCPGPNDAMTSMWQAPAWPRTRVTLDVNKLIDELVHKSVCLVRTPGVRRKDVNLAVKVAAGLVDS